MGSNLDRVSLPQVAGLILAAGRGTRMKSPLPKVLHKVAGRPMLEWVILALREAGVNCTTLILGQQTDEFKFMTSSYQDCSIVVQKDPRGTGDAVASASLAFKDVHQPSYAQGELSYGKPVSASHILICAGDTPAIEATSLAEFINSARTADVAVLGMRPPNPKGYGRLVTEGTRLCKIVEEKDCNEQERKISLVNSGVYLVKSQILFNLLEQIDRNNAQNEYYLTDIIKKSVDMGMQTRWHQADDAANFQGINDRSQLAEVESLLIRQKIIKAMEFGVTFRLPNTIHIDADVQIGPDSVIDSGCGFYGKTTIGASCKIGHGVVLRDVQVGDSAVIMDGSVVEGGFIGHGERVPAGTVLIVHKGAKTCAV